MINIVIFGLVAFTALSLDESSVMIGLIFICNRKNQRNGSF